MLRCLAVLLTIAVRFAIAQPEFEAASIKPAAAARNPGAWTFRTPPGSIVGTNVPLRELVRNSLQVLDYELVTPDWMRDAKFDINAKASTAADAKELRFMLRKLLADRFKLKFHVENREAPAMVMHIAKSGPKFHDAGSAEAGKDGAPFGMSPMFQRASMHTLAAILSTRCGTFDFLPVIDKTGLEGEYDVRVTTISFVPDPDHPIPPRSRSIYDEYCEAAPQLGLEFKRQKVAMDVYIVDSAEKTPTEN